MDYIVDHLKELSFGRNYFFICKRFASEGKTIPVDKARFSSHLDYLTALWLMELGRKNDETKLSVDREDRSVTLLSDEVERLYLKYSDLICELAVVPAYLDVSKPVEFYPEAEVVTFYLRNEIKQPAFIARSARNQYLMLWGNKSSYTDTNQNDIPKALQKWDQKVELSGWDESIISVDADGKITAKGVGETTITGKYMGFEATMKIVVEKLR